MSREGAESLLRGRAHRDQDFRARLIEDSRAAIESEGAITLAWDATVTVVEEQPGEVVLAIPSPRTATDEELAETVGAGIENMGAQMMTLVRGPASDGQRTSPGALSVFPGASPE